MLNQLNFTYAVCIQKVFLSFDYEIESLLVQLANYFKLLLAENKTF